MINPWKRLKNWFTKKYLMCKCAGSKFEVINGILCCEDCRKPKQWDARNQGDK